MKVNLIITDNESGGMIDAGRLTGSISVSTELGDTAGKLECELLKDPTGAAARVNRGACVALTVDGVNMFLGYVFKNSMDELGTQKLTCYDQKRYLKNQDTYLTKDMTASEIFQKLCADGGLSGSVIAPSSFVPPPRLHDTKTYYEIIEYAMMLCNINEGKQYFVRDNFGILEFTELEQEKLNVILGEKSLLTSYTHEISIDNDTYNRVKLVRDNKETEKRDVWIEIDSGNEAKWGRLQYFQKVDEDMNEAQVKQLAASLLRLKNRETKSLKLTALGVPELSAGSGICLSIKSLGLNEFVWLQSVKHSIEHELHTMDLEVFMPN